MCTPSDYRKRSLNEINKKSIFKKLSSSEIEEKIQRILSEDRDESNYRAAVNPLSLKVFGKAGQTFLPKDRENTPKIGDVEKYDMMPCEKKHYIPINFVPEMLDWTPEQFLKTIQLYENNYYMPVLIAEWNAMPETKTRSLLHRFFQSYHPQQNPLRIVFVMYNDLGEYNDVCRLINEFHTEYCDVSLHPILLSR